MPTQNKRKQRYKTAIPVNITLPPLLHEKLLDIVRNKGFSGPSDYFQSSIRMDAGLDLKREQTAC